MTARELYDRIATQLRSVPLPGISSWDVNAFLARYERKLIAAIQHQFDERCRLGRLEPGFEEALGSVYFSRLDLGPATGTWEAQFGGKSARLAVKSRCHPANPELREYAVHLYSDKLGRWLTFPGETWVWSKDEAVLRFVENQFTRMRWRDVSAEGGWEGALYAPIELESRSAIDLAKGWDASQPQSEDDLLELDRARQERWERHNREWSAARRNKPTAASATSAGSSKVTTSSTTTPPSAPGPVPTLEPTPWGGKRGAELPPEAVREGTRVVTPEGLHGTVVKTTELTSIVVGPRVTHERQKHTVFDVRLDSGRLELGGRHVFAEATRPEAVIPDLSFDDGKTFVAPLQAWREVLRDYNAIGYYTEKAGNARKPANRREYERLLRQSQEGFLRKFTVFHAWRVKHPNAPMGDLASAGRRSDPVAAAAEFSALTYRILELESGIDAPRWPGELKSLKALPKDYASRIKAGDPIRAHTTDGGGNWGQEDAILKAIDGETAILDDDSRTPLFYVRLAPDAPLELPTYTEPQYLVDLGASMLTESGSRYPSRGVVARAVKEFLALHGIDARTHVSAGSMVTSIDLRPGTGRWSVAELEKLNRLLGNLGARSDGASFEPWQREGREYSVYDDYPGKGPGLVIPLEHILVFAPLLAAAMKDAGQPLNRVGEGWLAKLRGPRAEATSSSARGGATQAQRRAAADGCREEEFDLPGYGHIRVVCGQKGRRDSWHNVFISDRRMGFNGGRWARGEVPPPAVLQAIRERGISAFDAGTERLNEPTPAQEGLDPVIQWTLEQGGIRPDQLKRLSEQARFRTRLIPGMVRPDGLTFRALGERWQEREEDGLRGFEPESIFIELYEFMLAESRIEYPDDLNPDDLKMANEALEPLVQVARPGATARASRSSRGPSRKLRRSTLERLPNPSDAPVQLDPVIQAAIANGGLRADLVRDIPPELRAKARAIVGFLQPDGRSWLELAQAHYGPDIPVVEGSPSLEEWDRTGAEGTDGFQELVHWGLAYSFPEVDEEVEEDLDYLPEAPQPSAGVGRATGSGGRRSRCR